MVGILYRYSHPYDSMKFIYVGQGAKRDRAHRFGHSEFGKRFKKFFPNVELPQPIRQEFLVDNQTELNELETIWMFQYHTWRGYPGGMNITFPGSTDYQNIGKIGGFRNLELGNLTWVNQLPQTRLGKIANGKIQGTRLRQTNKGIFGRSPQQMTDDGRKAGLLAVKTGNLAKARALISLETLRENGRRSGKIRGELPENIAFMRELGNKNAKNGHCAEISKKGLHVRWHVCRDIVKSTCDFCSQEYRESR